MTIAVYQVLCSCVDSLVIISLTSSYETIITDPIDLRVIHLAGFDSATPEIIRLFATGQLDSIG